MDHLITILSDCIVPFLDSFDLTKFMMVSHEFYEASQRAVKSLSKKYLVRYHKNGYDIKYIFSNTIEYNTLPNISYRRVKWLQIFRAYDSSLVNFDTILRYQKTRKYNIEYHYNTNPDTIPDDCYKHNSYVWIASRSFSVSICGNNRSLTYIYTRDHYGPLYEQTYNDIIKHFRDIGNKNYITRYALDRNGMSAMLTGESNNIIFFVSYPFIYPGHHVLKKEITFND